MKNFVSSKLSRATAAFLALTLVLLAFPWPVQAAGGIRINILSVNANKSVTVEALNFPAHEDFKVRVGPYYTFARAYRVMDTINSGSGGNFQFTVNLPDNVAADDLVAIRLDSPSGYYVYNAFYNTNKSASSSSPTATPVATQSPVVSGACQVISVSPANWSSFDPRFDFDAVWEVKNTSGKTWDANSVDIKYLGGEKFYKKTSAYDLPKSVKSGNSIKIVVDMLAPSQSGYYSTNWGLVSSSTTLCNLYLSIRVR